MFIHINLKNLFIVIGLLWVLWSVTGQAAELPVLEGATILGGGSSTAGFRGGATINNGVTYQSAFTGSDTLHVTAEITVQPDDVGAMGSIYVLLNVAGIGLFWQNINGDFVPFTAIDHLTARYSHMTFNKSEMLSST